MRLFIAVDLSETQKRQLSSLQGRLKHIFNDVKWVGPAGYHITLKFLGEKIPEEKLDSFSLLMQEAVTDVNPFELSLKGLGIFPDPRRPRIIWSGVNTGDLHIRFLWKQLDSILLREEISSSEESFSPHVTLGRIRRFTKGIPVKDYLNKYQNFSTPVNRVTHITLYQSILSRSGASYIPLKKINFS